MANCCGEEAAAAITAIASILAQGKTIEELALLSSEFSMLSSAITLIAAQRVLCEDKKHRITPSIYECDSVFCFSWRAVARNSSVVVKVRNKFSQLFNFTY